MRGCARFLQREEFGVDQLTRNKRVVALFAAYALFTTGCVGMDPGARNILQDPASCAEAREDIRALQGSRAGGFKRFTQGLQGIMPPMVVLSLLRDIYGKPYRSIYLDHWRVAFGSYNNKIDARVRKLQACAR